MSQDKYYYAYLRTVHIHLKFLEWLSLLRGVLNEVLKVIHAFMYGFVLMLGALGHLARRYYITQ